jgi:hypothetical protein
MGVEFLALVRAVGRYRPTALTRAWRRVPRATDASYSGKARFGQGSQGLICLQKAIDAGRMDVAFEGSGRYTVEAK